ncbi:MAG: HD domain-containing phosphohydrolase [Desulfocapsaceae bacterium]|nr:HD domain-containing phosphohydrolase [Desulfocapsaceae bacterium]
MARFDPDFSIFGILAGDLRPGKPIENTRIDYVNQACAEIYGDLTGMEFSELFATIAEGTEAGTSLMEKFKESGRISFEGKLFGRFVKFHSRIIDCRDDDACAITQYIQAGITDITESVILKKLLYGTSEALRRAAEAADDDTARHISRINEYSKLLATLQGADVPFIEKIASFAQLHDIGKIKIAQIIRLPRELTREEFSVVKKHPSFGGKMVKGLEGLEMAYDIIMDHHEKWDGSGYPRGKKAEEITLAGRIVGLVDVFDALVSSRPYKKSYDYDTTRAIIAKGDGRVMPTHFDPQLLQLFLENYQRFVSIHRKMKS